MPLKLKTHGTLTKSLSHFLHKIQFFLTNETDTEDTIFAANILLLKFAEIFCNIDLAEGPLADNLLLLKSCHQYLA